MSHAQPFIGRFSYGAARGWAHWRNSCAGRAASADRSPGLVGDRHGALAPSDWTSSRTARGLRRLTSSPARCPPDWRRISARVGADEGAEVSWQQTLRSRRSVRLHHHRTRHRPGTVASRWSAAGCVPRLHCPARPVCAAVLDGRYLLDGGLVNPPVSSPAAWALTSSLR